jgi:hypothetical protein
MKEKTTAMRRLKGRSPERFAETGTETSSGTT